MQKNEAFFFAVGQLERRFHNLVTELKSAGETYEGADLVNAIDRISIENGFENGL